MATTRFRIIFKGLSGKADSKKIVMFFQKELNLSNSVIGKFLMSPPRILWEVTSISDAEMIRKFLEKHGCKVSYESVIVYPSFPFAVSKKYDLMIKRELSKTLRGRTQLALALVQAEPENPQNILESMIGTVETKISESFRESDTIFGIDDNRLIFLGFSTDKTGVLNVKNKIVRVIKDCVGDDTCVTVGFSLFPEEGGNFQELLFLAEKNRENDEAVSSTASGSETLLYIPRNTDADEGDSTGNKLQLYFSKARGRVFGRLAEMDPQTLWIGLGQLPPAKQKEFLMRLPFDSPLVPELEDMIDIQAPFEHDKDAELRFKAIISQMESENPDDESGGLSEKVKTKLSKVENLPTLPSIAAEVFRLASDPNYSPEELSAVIMNDPPLTSKLLKTVNSAYYGNLQKIGTVKQAVIFLGMGEIMDLAFSLAAAKVFDIKLEKGNIDPKALWRHSICTALIAQNLCRGLTEIKKTGIMTAGLLHDLGKIFLIEHFPEEYETVMEAYDKQNIPLPDLETDVFGVDHAEIGMLLSTNWNLPAPLVQSITHHHHPLSAESHSEQAALVGLADYLYHEATKPDNQDGNADNGASRLTQGHWALLTRIFNDLDPAHLEKMVSDATNVIKISHDLLAVLDRV